MKIKNFNISEKLIYEILSFIYIVCIFVQLSKYFDSYGFIILAFPSILFITSCVIITPILLKQQPALKLFKQRIEMFYITLSFWFLINIIYFIWKI